MNEINAIQPLYFDHSKYSLIRLAFKLHVQAYRNTCASITHLASLVFHKIFPSIEKREREIKELTKKLGEDSIYPSFCKETAHYIQVMIPRGIEEGLKVIPYTVENWLLYKLGYLFRYGHYQLNKRLHYREAIISSVFGKYIQGQYGRLRTQLAHGLMHQDVVNFFVNFEHLFLRLLNKILNEPSKLNINPFEILVKSLAISLSQKKEMETYLSQFSFKSEEDTFIARLEWLKKHECLPKGLPDPEQVSLTSQNLAIELDKAASQYLEEYMVHFVQLICPQEFKRGLLKIIYFLEGKDILIQLFAYLINEFGIKQLADPHLLTLAILTSSGIEVMDYECEGFGRHKSHLILQTGKKIMSQALNPEANSLDLVRIFQEAGLKLAPKSFEGILQKKEAKERLEKHLSTTIYTMAKSEDFQHPDNILKTLEQKTCHVPFIGAATTSLHFLTNVTSFSFHYFFKHRQENISYPEFMLKHLMGKKSTDYLAQRIVALIYDPSWRIIVMQLIDLFLASLKEPEKQPSILKIFTLQKDIQIIAKYLFDYFTQPTESVILKNIDPGGYLKVEDVLNLFSGSVQSKDVYLQKIVKSFLPTIKELLLYTVVIESFRKEGVVFEGDAKFWEYFLRASLNQLVENKIQQQLGPSQTPTLTQLFEFRDQEVDRLLSLSQPELRSVLSKLSDSTQTLSFHHPCEIIEDYK